MHVNGVGDPQVDIMFVGEAPGYDEDRTGIPFSGRVGKELDRFLDGNNLPLREDVWLTLLYRDYRGKKYVWTEADLQQYEPELIADLRKVQPRVIVTLGRPATRWFMGDVDISAVEGQPYYLPDTCTKYPPTPHRPIVFPLIHPAAAFHNPEMSPYVVEGFRALAAFLDGQTEARVLFDDPYPNPVYREITNLTSLRKSLKRLTTSNSIEIDTEGWPGNPWSVQYCVKEGTGFLIRATRKDLLQEFIRILRKVRPTLTFHSALHDLGMGRALGIDFDGLTYDDTMVAAYLLQLVPQGLKPGSLRYCGMKMDSYMDILGDTANDLTRDYLMWIYDIEQMEYEERQQEEFDRKRAEGRRIKVLPKLPKTPLMRAVTRVLQSSRPYSLWRDQVEDVQVAGYRRMGPPPEATLDYVEPAKAIHYGCRDTDATRRLKKEYWSRIQRLKLEDVYHLEMSTYPLLDRMQRVGVKPDLEHFAELSKGLAVEIESLQDELVQATGAPTFNANSGDQVAEYLFGALGLEEIKMTSGGRGSTNDKILEALENEHPEYPVISTIRLYRETYKLKNTFVDRLPDHVHRWPYDGRIHTTLRTTRVVTGRLASADPNMLAMPKHGRFAKDFRRGWVAEEGHVLGSWDLSQIELRIAAHLSQDPVMLKIYRGEMRNKDGSLIDLHAALAERIFGVSPKEQDESKHRLPSKAINFGFWMGQTARGLETELRKNGLFVSEDDAQRWLDDAHSLYKGAKPYMDRRIAEAHQNGFIRCMSGRIRYIGGIRSSDSKVREEAERFAFSTPIQEGAQTVMKTNECHLWNHILVPLQKQGHWVEPLLQIHDDLLLEMSEKLVKTVNPMMVRCMEESYKGLTVPIKTSASAGLNWADMGKLAS